MNEKTKGLEVLCADPQRVLELVAAAIFPSVDGRVMGGALIRRAEELAIDAARLQVALDTARYAPPVLDEKTGKPRDAVDRVGRLVLEHATLVDRWAEAELELASLRQRDGADAA